MREQRTKGKRGDFPPHTSFCHKLPVIYYLKKFYWLNYENVHKKSFIGPNTFKDPIYSFTRCFASSQHNLCTLVPAMSLISLLHTILDSDGGPRQVVDL